MQYYTVQRKARLQLSVALCTVGRSLRPVARELCLNPTFESCSTSFMQGRNKTAAVRRTLVGATFHSLI
jgi:hypothetical protein